MRASTTDVMLADVHLREETADLVQNTVMPSVLAACEKLKAPRLVLLGDILHIRYRVPVTLLNILHQIFQTFRDAAIPVVILPGNHDQVDVQGRHALEVFDEMEGVDVISAPVWRADGLWVPYRPHLQSIEEALALPRPSPLGETPDNVCWIHYGVRGALRNNHQVDADGIDPQRFDAFDAVFCGHYHKQQELGKGGKIRYIGSPYQTRADEAGDPKGYATWDGKTFKRVQMNWGRTYARGRVQDVGDVERVVGEHPKDAQFRLQVGHDVDLAKVGKHLESLGITDYILTPELAPAQQRLQVQDTESVEAFAQAYVQQAVKGDTQRQETVWAMFTQLTQGAHDERGA